MHGLVALMEIQASRLRARIDATGQPILLLDQNRACWDRVLIGRDLAALARAEKLGGTQGPYALQASIATCHARATTAEQTDWKRIAALYSALVRIAPSPVVELNRAVAVAMVSGAQAGLDLVDALNAEPSLERIICSRACAAICSQSSAAARKRRRNSSAPRRWPATRANASCCSIVPRPAQAQPSLLHAVTEHQPGRPSWTIFC